MTRKIKLSQIIPTYGPSSGGVGSVVESIAEGFLNSDYLEVEVEDLGVLPKYQDGVKLHSSVGFKPVAIFRLLRRLLLKRPDITHLHGIWHPISAACLLARILGRHKHICSPHGMLTPWILSKNRVKKAIFRIACEHWHWSNVDCFHALTDAEAQEIAEVVPRGKPIAIIGNGVEIDPHPPLRLTDVASKPYILYIGRFHEKKGIDPLLRAWESMKLSGVSLKLVGWGSLECLKHSLPNNVEVLPPVFDPQQKSKLMREAEFVILPSFSEGLPMVILESWAQATPVIMTRGCNLPEGFLEDCAIEVEPEAISITKGLERALGMSPIRRQEMGRKGWDLCAREYSLPSVRNRLKMLYEGIMQDGGFKNIKMYKWHQ